MIWHSRYSGRRHSNSRGYTLVEIMVVLSIISLLLGATIFFTINMFGAGKRARVMSDIRALQGLLMTYQLNARNFPSTEQGLSALYKRPVVPPVPARWEALVKESATLDPWDRPYRYAKPGKRSGTDFDIYSVGEDGKEGTEDDIGNWSN